MRAFEDVNFVVQINLFISIMKQRFSLVLMLMSAVSFIYGQCECKSKTTVWDWAPTLGHVPTITSSVGMSSSNLARP